VPFVRDAVRPAPVASFASSAPASHDDPGQTAFPGGSWLYAKLYGGYGTLDRVVEAVAALAERMKRERGLRRWFFVRLGDPDWHLRARFDVTDMGWGEAAGELHALGARLAREQLTWRLQFDTYQRETNRYGGPRAIETVEDIFHADSEAVAAILPVVEAADRWQAGVAGIDGLLSSFGRPLEDKLNLVTKARERFALEFAVDGAMEKRLSELGRQHRNRVEAILRTEGASIGVDGILVRRKKKLAPLIERLRAADAATDDVLLSLLHMHVNRLIPVQQRRHEMVLYDLLRRAYDTRAHRRP
jgi:thiopeptide-type bacteriocin biosynthesis protein